LAPLFLHLVWQSRSRSFDPFAAWANNIFNVTGDGEAERVAGFGVTARFFDVLRVRPLGQRSEQDAIDHAEHGSGGPDAQRQCEQQPP
jgi:hypothetical protein